MFQAHAAPVARGRRVAAALHLHPECRGLQSGFDLAGVAFIDGRIHRAPAIEKVKHAFQPVLEIAVVLARCAPSRFRDGERARIEPLEEGLLIRHVFRPERALHAEDALVILDAELVCGLQHIHRLEGVGAAGIVEIIRVAAAHDDLPSLLVHRLQNAVAGGFVRRPILHHGALVEHVGLQRLIPQDRGFTVLFQHLYHAIREITLQFLEVFQPLALIDRGAVRALRPLQLRHLVAAQMEEGGGEHLRHLGEDLIKRLVHLVLARAEDL